MPDQKLSAVAFIISIIIAIVSLIGIILCAIFGWNFPGFFLILFLASGCFSVGIYRRVSAFIGDFTVDREALAQSYVFIGLGCVFLCFIFLMVYSSFYPSPLSFSDNIINETEPLAMDYFNPGQYLSVDKPIIKGKVLVYNIEEDTEVYDVVPDELKIGANETPNKVTIFFINQTEVEVGRYKSESDILGFTVPGYQIVTTVVIVYWPEKKVVGKFRIEGNKPNDEEIVPSGAQKVVGEGDNLKEWILSLPRQ